MSLDVYAILYPDYVSVRKSSSLNGLSSASDKVLFGIVDAVNAANMRTNVGNTIYFDSERSRIVTQGDGVNTWYIVHEDDIIFKEIEEP